MLKVSVAVTIVGGYGFVFRATNVNTYEQYALKKIIINVPIILIPCRTKKLWPPLSMKLEFG